MVQRHLGPFELIEKIGAGGMGVVYRAIYTKNGKKVALKLLPTELSQHTKLVKRFARELKVLQKLRHKNIVLCYGGGRKGKRQFYAMEYVDGGSMDDLLKKKGRLSWEETIHYGLQICAALEHAHQHGVVHRDLKPANLFLTRDGTLKLGDFGLARVNDATQLTAAGKTMGTFAYMAPEQICGKPAISHKTDLYALGCVLFEMLTGKPPFASKNPAELFYQHLHTPPQRVASLNPDCPVWLDSVVQNLLAKKVEDRPFDALAVSTALHEVQEKVAGRASMLQHNAAAGATTIGVRGDTVVAKSLLAKRKKKKRKKGADGPLFEQTWFLVTALVLLFAVITWALWPAGESRLFAKAQALMETDDQYKWMRAYNEYLQRLKEDYPNGPHAQQVQDYIDKYKMHRAEDGIKTRARFGAREPKSEAERLYVKAWEYEKFGDRVTALDEYRSMTHVLDEDNEEHRPFIHLALRQIAEIERAGIDENQRTRVVKDAFNRGDRLYEEGKVIQARQIWNSIIKLYDDNREMRPFVQQAQDRLADPENRVQHDRSDEQPGVEKQ